MVRLTLTTALLHNLLSSREQHDQVDQAGDESSRNGNQRVPSDSAIKQAGNTGRQAEQRASRESQSKDYRQGCLHAKVDGEKVRLNCREDGPGDRLEHDRSIDEGLQTSGLSHDDDMGSTHMEEGRAQEGSVARGFISWSFTGSILGRRTIECGTEPRKERLSSPSCCCAPNRSRPGMNEQLKTWLA